MLSGRVRVGEQARRMRARTCVQDEASGLCTIYSDQFVVRRGSEARASKCACWIGVQAGTDEGSGTPVRTFNYGTEVACVLSWSTEH